MGGAHTRNRLRAKRLGDYCACALGILRGNAAWNPYDCEALAFQPRIAFEVGLDSLCMLMCRPIHLDDQSTLEANEIQHEWSDRMLAAKPQAPLLPASQDVP